MKQFAQCVINYGWFIHQKQWAAGAQRCLALTQEGPRFVGGLGKHRAALLRLVAGGMHPCHSC